MDGYWMVYEESGAYRTRGSRPLAGHLL